MTDITSIIKQSPPVDVSKPYDGSTVAGKMIVITGAANGLGSHMARRWAELGAHITIGDVADQLGEALVAELRAKHPAQTILYQHCDVADWDQQVALFDAAVAASPHGAIDIVVPNAGILVAHEASEFEHPRLVNGKLPRPSFTTWDVNVVGTSYTTHLALHHLPRTDGTDGTGRGAPKDRDRCLLLIGSVSSLMPFPSQTHYTMSKHAILGLFRTLRCTAFPHGIRVNMVLPFYTTKSNMLPKWLEAGFLSGSPGGGSIADVVDAATRLIADEAVAGRALVVGPRMQTDGVPGVADEDPRMAVDPAENAGEGRGIWEVYADDYSDVDTVIRRYVHLLNAITTAKGWLGLFGDLWRIITRR